MSWIRMWLHLDDPDRAEQRKARRIRNSAIKGSMNRVNSHTTSGGVYDPQRPPERYEGR
ncbi:MAG: hypothetical protein QOH03_1818 [Kribbellaceae bacterium]|nr:hypothetical protein [Kribbellaceae bacterium]